MKFVFLVSSVVLSLFYQAATLQWRWPNAQAVGERRRRRRSESGRKGIQSNQLVAPRRPLGKRESGIGPQKKHWALVTRPALGVPNAAEHNDGLQGHLEDLSHQDWEMANIKPTRVSAMVKVIHCKALFQYECIVLWWSFFRSLVYEGHTSAHTQSTEE